VLCFTLVRSRLECSSVVRNSTTSTDANKLERIQQKFASVSVVFPLMFLNSYTLAVEKLSLHSLRKRRHHLDALFFSGLSWPALPSWKMLSLRVSTVSVRNFLTFSVCPSNKQCPSARCACAANVVDKDLDYLQSKRFLSVIFYNLLPKIFNNI
jgi:hypothetical protein